MIIPTGDPINISDYKNYKTVDELKSYIFSRVKDTQKFLMKPLPDKLIMNHDQFKLLGPDFKEYEGIHTRLYFTPMNCMEVQVEK